MKHISILLIFILFSCKQKTNSTAFVSEAGINKEVVYDSLEVYDFGGIQKFLNKTDDKTYVVNFWATWCLPCVKELPYFEKLNAEYKSKNVEVLLISLDFPNQYDSKLKPFLKKHNIKSKVIALNDTDMNTWIPKVNENWSGSIPATIIYNKNKRDFYEQSFTYEELENKLKPLLN